MYTVRCGIENCYRLPTAAAAAFVSGRTELVIEEQEEEEEEEEAHWIVRHRETMR